MAQSKMTTQDSGPRIRKPGPQDPKPQDQGPRAWNPGHKIPVSTAQDLAPRTPRPMTQYLF